MTARVFLLCLLGAMLAGCYETKCVLPPRNDRAAAPDRVHALQPACTTLAELSGLSFAAAAYPRTPLAARPPAAA